MKCKKLLLVCIRRLSEPQSSDQAADFECQVFFSKASREKAVEEAWRKNKQDLQTEMTKLEQNPTLSMLQ